ncbi:hypothetical protein D3C85_1848010 [compost metagenome]
MTPLQKEISTLVRNTPVGGHYNGKLGGRGAANGMYDAFGKVAQDILLGKTDTMAILRYLDETWDKNADKQSSS